LVYFFTIYLNILVPENNKFKELSDFQTLILENTEEHEQVFVINHGVADTYPALHQINRWNASPYLNHFPYNWGWTRDVGYTERVTTEPLPIIEQWESRVGQSIHDTSPNLIIIHPNIDFYLEHVGFIDKYMDASYRQIEVHDDFIAYKRMSN